MLLKNDDLGTSIKHRSDHYHSGNIHVTATVDGVKVSNLSSTVATQRARISTLSITVATYKLLRIIISIQQWASMKHRAMRWHTYYVAEFKLPNIRSTPKYTVLQVVQRSTELQRPSKATNFCRRTKDWIAVKPDRITKHNSAVARNDNRTHE